MRCIVCNDVEIDKVRYDPRDGRELPCSVCQGIVDDCVSDYYKNDLDTNQTLEVFLRES